MYFWSIFRLAVRMEGEGEGEPGLFPRLASAFFCYNNKVNLWFLTISRTLSRTSQAWLPLWVRANGMPDLVSFS